MAPHESVEIRLVCKADYLDPQLKVKLHEIKEKLREILNTGRHRFALKKVQPWNSIKVTFDIPKEAADRLRLLAVQGNTRLIELGILSVEIVGQSNTIPVNPDNNSSNNATANLTTKNSSSFTVSSKGSSLSEVGTVNSDSTIHSTPINPSHDVKIDDRNRHKRIKLEHDVEHSMLPPSNHGTPHKDRPISSSNSSLVQIPTTMISSSSTTIMQQNAQHGTAQSPSTIVHRPSTPSQSLNNNYVRISHTNSIMTNHPGYLNNTQQQPSSSSNAYSVSSLPIDTNNVSNNATNEMHSYAHSQPVYHQESWTIYPDPANNYKMKVNGVRPAHYYGQQQQMIISENTSTSSSNMFCASAPTNQFDLRRCEPTINNINISTTNLANNFDTSSS